MKKVLVDYMFFILLLDFLVDFGKFFIVFDIFYSKDLNKVYVIELLEIKCCYWEEEYNMLFKLIIEKDIFVMVLENIKWLYVEKNDFDIINYMID